MIECIGDLPFPGPPPDSAAVYRLLRDLEKRGLVKSQWQTGEAGPSKRIYHITRQGEERLEVWVAALKERVRILNRFISLCEKPG
jgi:PadR family transcriptional regulator PadR